MTVPKEQKLVYYRCERTLISIWVATFLVNVIQDLSDPMQKEYMRHSTRGWNPGHRDTPIISFLLPQDFGSESYFERRRGKIEIIIEQMKETSDLNKLFDKFLGPSTLLRDYLWVNEDSAIETAREALFKLPKKTVIDSIYWAIQDFWKRQPGWPDFLIYRDAEYRFVEVKSPHDRLSQEQQNWFEWAITDAQIPCEIFRIKRAAQNIPN